MEILYDISIDRFKDSLFITSQVAQWLRIQLPLQEMQESQVWSLGQEDPLKEEMATHSDIFSWKNPMGRGAWQTTVHKVSKVRCDWANEHAAQFNKTM